MFLSAIPIVGKIFGRLFGIIDQVVEDKDQAAKLKHDLEMGMMEKDFSFVEEELKARASIIAAEARGESWLQRNWRPLLMMTFTYIVAHNHIISPMFSLPRLDIPPDMWELLKLGMGGYIIGRSVEKGIGAWKKAN